VDTQAHIQEIASMVQQALAQSGEGSEASLDAKSLSTSEINSQIHSTIQEAIKSQTHSQSGAGSKLGFLQQVVSLECFFGGSTCLFQDKSSMKAGKVTEFAKKRFEEGNHNVNQYLAQVQDDVSRGMHNHAFAQQETSELVQTVSNLYIY